MRRQLPDGQLPEVGRRLLVAAVVLLLLAVASTVYSSLRPETADTAMTLAAEIDGGTDRRFALTALVSEVVTGRAARSS